MMAACENACVSACLCESEVKHGGSSSGCVILGY